MHIFKKIVRGLSAYAFRVSLFGFALILGFVLTFGSSDSLKTAVSESGLYESPLTNLMNLGEITDQENKPEQAEISIDDPIVQNAIATAFPGTKKQMIVEEIIDGSYVWLNGRSEYPAFSIDISEEKSLIIQTLADDTYSRIETLPNCTIAQLQELNKEFDPFTIPCRPPINLEGEKQKLIDEYSTNEAILSDTTFDGEELFKEGERHDSTNNAKYIPVVFGAVMRSPYFFAGVAIVSIIGVLLLADTRTKGIHKLGKLFIETAVSLIIVGVGLYLILSGAKANLGSVGTPELQAAIGKIFDSLRAEILLPSLLCLIAYIVIGALLLIIYNKRKSLQ